MNPKANKSPESVVREIIKLGMNQISGWSYIRGGEHSTDIRLKGFTGLYEAAGCQ